MNTQARVHRAVLVTFCGQHFPVDPVVVADVSLPPLADDEWQAFARDQAERVARDRASADASIEFEANCTGPGTVYMQAISDVENALADLAGVVDEVLHREGDDLDAEQTDRKLTSVRDQLRELAESFAGNR